MEKSLALLDGKILLIGLIGIVIGWIIRWAVTRRATKLLLAQAESEVEAKTANIDALKHDLSLRDRTISEQKESLSELNRERTSQAEKIRSQETDIGDLTSKLELLDSSQSESGDAIAVLEDTVAGLEEQISSEKTALEKLTANHRQEIQNLESECTLVTDRLAASKKTSSELASELAATKETSENLRLELGAKNAALEKRATPLNQLKDELAQITHLRQRERGELSNLQSSLTIWQGRAEKAETQLAQSRKIVDEINNANTSSAKPDRSYEKLLLLKDQEISAQKTQTHEAQAKLLSVRELINTHQTEIEALKEQLQKRDAQSNRELASIQRKFEEQKLSGESAAANDAKQRGILQERIDHLAAQNTSISRELAAANENLDELNAANKSLLREFNQNADKLRVQRAEINTLISTNEDLEAQLARAGIERDTVKRRYDNVRREVHAKNNTIEELNAALTKHEIALQHCETKLQAKSQQFEAENQAPKLHTNRPAQVDDLKRIKGVGPALEKMLNDLGIYQFSQLATLNNNEVAWVDDHIESFKGRIYRDEWVKQARNLCAD